MKIAPLALFALVALASIPARAENSGSSVVSATTATSKDLAAVMECSARGGRPIGVPASQLVPVERAAPSAAEPASDPAAPAIQALGTMLQQSQNREAENLVQVFTLKAQLAAATKRADAAEAKIPKPETPKN